MLTGHGVLMIPKKKNKKKKDTRLAEYKKRGCEQNIKS